MPTVAGLAWQGLPSYTVLDTAFALGERFLDTWAAWLADPHRPTRLHYVAVTPSPPTLSDIQIRSHHPGLVRELAHEWWGLVPGVYRLRLAGGRLSLCLAVGALPAMLKNLACDADAVYLTHSDDDLSNSTASLDTLKAVTRHCQRGTVVMADRPHPAWCDELKALGYDIHIPTGTGLVATFAPHWSLKRQHTKALSPSRAVVIGAGLSGASVARQLAEHGWEVDVLDQARHPAAGASALPVGLMCTHASPDDAPLSRASRAGIRATRHALKTLCIEGQDWCQTGALDLSSTSKSRWPQDWESPWREAWYDSHAKGLLHPAAAWVKPAALVKAWLDHPRIRFVGAASVKNLVKRQNLWSACDAQGVALSSAPLMVVCTAHATRHLLPNAERLPLDLVAGQVAMAPGSSSIKRPINGHGHLIPNVPVQADPENSFWLAGSTYERAPLHQLDPDHGLAANRLRLAQMLQNFPLEAAAIEQQFERQMVQHWRGERCTSIDRLPLVGEWQPGLHVSAAMGSRGLSMAALCAEILVTQLTAQPCPVDFKLAQKFAVQRYHRLQSPSGHPGDGDRLP